MEINRRALYNSLRMNWILDPTLEVEAWQVEDYRSMPLDALFEKLEDKNIHLDKHSFLGFAEELNSPEDLTDALVADLSLDTKTQDQLYLIIFELWRRLLPEKPSISMFCDEIDYQIHLYDRGQVENIEAIQDALANLQVILDENVDEGIPPRKAFNCINEGCANDLESFLHDFISDLIDNGNYSYATELLEGFGNYVSAVTWFEFLRARIIAANDPEEANTIIHNLIMATKNYPDLELYLEILSFLVHSGDQATFEQLLKRTIDLIKVEEDFQTLIAICADFYHRMDHDHIEKALQAILEQREPIDLNKAFNRKDPHVAEFFKIIAQ